jgi:hypothetical protein
MRSKEKDMPKDEKRHTTEEVDALVTYIQWGCPEEHELEELVAIGEMCDTEADQIIDAILFCKDWPGGRG